MIIPRQTGTSGERAVLTSLAYQRICVWAGRS